MYMKKIKTIIFALVCAFFLFGCDSTIEQTKSPTETLKALSEASKKKDTEAIKSYLSKGTLDLFQQSATRREKTVEELLKEENGAPFQNLNEIKNEQITGETAVVEVKNNVSGEFDKIPFVKENGVWKVALDVYMKDAIKRLNEEMNIPANNTSLPESESNKSAANTVINKK
jgi:PBP1b-binding outer membrane lipoprotein LpoB